MSGLIVGIMLIEAGWLSAGVTWLVKFYVDCPIHNAKETVLGTIVLYKVMIVGAINLL